MTVPGFTADWPDPPGVRTWQTTRAGGSSSGRYASQNLGAHVGDDPACVTANRDRLRDEPGLPAEPLWLDQVHGDRILAPDRGETGAADGAVTSAIGRVLVVMTADCLPVLIASRTGEVVGVAHAGWRGLAGGVLEAAIAAMQVPPAGIQVWLGPAITQDAFEVGDDVRQAFTGIDPAAAECFARNESGRWQADLYALTRQRLRHAGVSEIFGSERCTYGDPERYFSHRREAPCGRMASLIWREEPD
jgi:YfiH family protein